MYFEGEIWQSPGVNFSTYGFVDQDAKGKNKG